RARVADDAPRPERARAVLHAPGEPADDLPGADLARDALEERRLVALVGRVARAEVVEVAADRGALVARPEEGAGHRVLRLRPARLIQQLMPDQQRDAERAARIACRRLNPDVLVRPFAKKLSVRNTVQRYAAREHQILQFRFSMDVPRGAHEDLLA